MALLEPIFEALNAHGVRYVVVGGLATVLHGHARLTADVDLIVDLTPAEAKKAIDALLSIGFVPRAPVQAHDFADEAVRGSWIADKGMRVFSLWDPKNPMREVDLFVEHPLPFAELHARAEQRRLGSQDVHVASIADLISLKRMAGRPVDVDDIAALESIQERRSKHG